MNDPRPVQPATDPASHARLHAVIESLREGVLMYDRSGAVVDANPAALALLEIATPQEIGITPEFLQSTFDVFTPEGRPVPVEDWPARRVLRGECVSDMELLVVNRRTGRTWVSSHSGSLVRCAPDEPELAVLSIRDVTHQAAARQALRASEERLRAAFATLADQVYILDAGLAPLYRNPAATASTACDVPGTVAFWKPIAERALRNADSVTAEVRHVDACGTRDFLVTATPLPGPHDAGAQAGGQVVVIARDCTEQKKAEEAVRRAALHDPLTGLPNRTLLYEFARHAFAAALRTSQQVAIVFVDLDRFKPINDIYGHEIGDRLLCDLAGRLQGCLRGEDLIARFGGDEFVVMLPQLEHAHLPGAVAAKLIDVVSRPVQVDRLELAVSASLGISVFPDDGDTLDELLRHADAAMYVAKQGGRNDYRFYSEIVSPRAIDQSHIEHALKLAIAHEELHMVYQPVVEIATGRVLCVEALVRWDGGGVGPDTFIPVAEAAGLIGPLSEWGLHEVCRQHKRWRDAGLPPLPIAINVSPVQFRKRGFVEGVERILTEQHVPPGAFHMELTETAVMENIEHAAQTLTRFRQLGVKIALDDFGQGYSSLSYLSRLPIDKIKIDKSFIQNIERDHASRAITDAVIALGQTLGLAIVAEGVETRAMLEHLRSRGCGCAQGFYFCRPIDGATLETLLRRNGGFLVSEDAGGALPSGAG